jgi:tetratricopeptide (TPR) repeat protein
MTIPGLEKEDMINNIKMNRLFAAAVIAVCSFFITTPAQGQESIYGTDSLNCIQNLSLYREYFKQDNFDDAYKPWQWVITHCPKVRKQTFLDGVAMMEAKIKSEKDSAKKEELMDSLMWIYDQRIIHFGEEGMVLGRKAYDLFTYRTHAIDEVFELFRRSVDLQRENSEAFVISGYFQAAIERFRQKKMTKEEVIDLYDQLSEMVEYNIKNGINEERNKIAQQNLDNLFDPFATCEDLISIYSAKVKEAPRDTALLEKVNYLLQKKGCTDSQLFETVAKNLYNIKPSAESAMALAEFYLKKGQNTEAINYLQEVLNQEEDNMKKADLNFKIAQIYFQARNYSSARTYAQRALQFRPDWGKPYLLIGDAYASSMGQCSDDEHFKGKEVMWAALDKYYQARSVDSSVAEEANRKISTYRAYLPEKGDIFFKTLNEGDTYKVGCWINETVTVRLP